MLKLFLIKNSLLLGGGAQEKALALTDGERKEKVNSLVPEDKRAQSLAAGVILPLALKECGYGGEIKIVRGEWGKPRLITPKGWFYNLSHSDEFTVIALSDGETGVDIQKIRETDLRLADRYFSKSEAEYVKNSPDPQEAFFEVWTAKEAYLKALGAGLNRPLNSFTVNFADGKTEVTDPENAESWVISEVRAPSGYKFFVCAKEPFAGEAKELFL